MIHYYKTKLRKMGTWSLMPADSGSWHGQDSSDEFRKEFGFGKGLLAVHTLDDGFQHMYVPLSYVVKLYSYIGELRAKGIKTFENKMRRFYKIKKLAKAAVPKLSVKDYTKLTDKSLATLYEKIRHWTHRATIYDQLGWLSEEYWNQPMDEVLIKRLKLKQNSEEYNQVLFTLTKPEEISTTLEEKRAVLKEAQTIKKGKSIKRAAKSLSKEFGWMPVFTYGDPWDSKHYELELAALAKKSFKVLEQEFSLLRDYTKIRNREIETFTKQYKLGSKDLQVFIDFGVALDARNEAEYVLSFTAFYLLPIYREIARRWSMSTKQIRSLEETEITACLRGEKSAEGLLDGRRRIFGWGFDEKMVKMTLFSEAETEKLFTFVEKHARAAPAGEKGKGITASPGKARGRARIIFSPEQNFRVKDGDILITIATTVDYLPAMKRAAAFVTEVGGLTCHAAVVAREFGVPCVVGLKNATINFKDGDLVEVDANRGIVKQLK